MMGVIDTHVSKVVTSGKEGGKWDQGGGHRSFNCKVFLLLFVCFLIKRPGSGKLNISPVGSLITESVAKIMGAVSALAKNTLKNCLDCCDFPPLRN